MKLRAIQIHSYKAFEDTEWLDLSDHITLVIGPNNVGKSAFLEAIAGCESGHHHRHLEGRPGQSPSGSWVRYRCAFAKTEIERLYPASVPMYLPSVGDEPMVTHTWFKSVLGSEQTEIEFNEGPGTGNQEMTIDGRASPPAGSAVSFRRRPSGELDAAVGTAVGVPPHQLFARACIPHFRSRTVLVRAERGGVRPSTTDAALKLLPSGDNLSQVLGALQASNPPAFERLQAILQTIVPEVTQLTVPPVAPGTADVHVWWAPRALARADLSVPLSSSGTGITQLLTILYHVVASPDEKLILLDEPQSFLHPGAVRRLFAVLRENDQHQYVISSHSPLGLTALQPDKVLRIARRDGRSRVYAVDSDELASRKQLLDDLGVSIADVFGATAVIWVEGQTEEGCLPEVVNSSGDAGLADVAFVRVRSTGEVTGRQMEAAIDLHVQLAARQNILPPAVGFLLDKDGRSAEARERLTERARGQLRFLPVRMFECLLLDAEAVAQVLQARWRSDSPPPPAAAAAASALAAACDEESPAGDCKDTHGKRVLERAFDALSGGRLHYRPTVDGPALTRAILRRHPDHFAPLRGLISELLDVGRVEGRLEARLRSCTSLGA